MYFLFSNSSGFCSTEAWFSSRFSAWLWWFSRFSRFRFATWKLHEALRMTGWWGKNTHSFWRLKVQLFSLKIIQLILYKILDVLARNAVSQSFQSNYPDTSRWWKDHHIFNPFESQHVKHLVEISWLLSRPMDPFRPLELGSLKFAYLFFAIWNSVCNAVFFLFFVETSRLDNSAPETTSKMPPKVWGWGVG